MIFASQSPKGNFTFDKAIPGNPRVSITEHAIRVIRVKMVPLIERELNATVIIATATDNSSENDILRRDANTVRNNCQKVARGGEGNQRCGVIVLAPIETVAR